MEETLTTYALTEGYSHMFMGVFSSVEAASHYIYNLQVYRHYRGYTETLDIPKLQWYGDEFHYYAREVGQWNPPKIMGKCYYELTPVTVDPVGIGLDLDYPTMYEYAQQNDFGAFEDLFMGELPT